MTDIQDKWMPLDEAIQHVMKVKRCSHNKAIQVLAKASKKGKLPFRRTMHNVPELKPLSPQEAMQEFSNDPASLCITLAAFKESGNFTNDEMLGELRAGRLIATSTDAVFFEANRTGRVKAADFIVTFEKIANWMAHPKTPPHMLAKWQRSIEQRPS